METAIPSSILHVTLKFTTTRPTEFVDVTDRLAAAIKAGGLCTGIVNVQTRHTTTAVIVNEHEPLLLTDFLNALERVAPRRTAYAHDEPGRMPRGAPDEERPNGHAHCKALFLPASVCLNVVGGELQLGRWQRVFLVELDGPRERAVSVTMVGEGGR